MPLTMARLTGARAPVHGGCPAEFLPVNLPVRSWPAAGGTVRVGMPGAGVRVAGLAARYRLRLCRGAMGS